LDLPSEPTLSDGTAGGVEPGSITFELLRDCVDRSVTVTEEEIARAMKTVITAHHTCIEGAAGVAVAAFLQDPDRYEGKDVAIVLCGANASGEVLRRVLA
jgi:threonine dehydratase